MSHHAEDAYTHADWLKIPLRPHLLRREITKAAKFLKANGIEFDAIAFRGLSGALLAAPLAARLKKELILVRKDEDKTHSAFRVEGFRATKRYIIADDLISTGATCQAITEAIKNFAYHAVCVGALVFNNSVSRHHLTPEPSSTYRGMVFFTPDKWGE